MGLDVYVGTLTRYLSGDWELAAATFAREAGLSFDVVRAHEPEDAVTDPEELRPAVLGWRDALGQAIGEPLAWPEDDTLPYFTDKPDWSGYWALLLIAAHEEQPDVALPEALPEKPFEHPLLEERVGGGRRGLLRRRKASDEPPRYASLYTPELWLPAETNAVWKAPFLTGETVGMASTTALREDLRDLARRLDASPADLDEWRASGGGGEVVGTVEVDGRTFEQIGQGSVLELGRFGLAVFLQLVEQAVENRLPMKLDY